MAVAYLSQTRSMQLVQEPGSVTGWFNRNRVDIRQCGARPGARFCVWGIPLYIVRSLVAAGLRWLVAVDPGL